MQRHYFFIVLITILAKLSFAIPENYDHKSVATQIEEQRAALDPVIAQPEYDLLLTPVLALGPILENGFALINDIIQKDNSRSQTEKAPYLNRLVILWDYFSSNKDGLSMVKFAYYNAILSYIIQQYYNQETLRDINIENGMSSFLRSFAQYHKNPYFIVYLNPRPVPKRSVGTARFIAEFFKKNGFRANIAVLDSLKHHELEAEMPHGGKYFQASDIFIHDQAHAERIDKYIVGEIYVFLSYINDIADSAIEDESYQMLKDGIFMLYRELLCDHPMEAIRTSLKELLATKTYRQAFIDFMDLISNDISVLNFFRYHSDLWRIISKYQKDDANMSGITDVMQVGVEERGEVISRFLQRFRNAIVSKWPT